MNTALSRRLASLERKSPQAATAGLRVVIVENSNETNDQAIERLGIEPATRLNIIFVRFVKPDHKKENQ